MPLRKIITYGYGDCDYYRGRGKCSMGGCYTEPSCVTDSPSAKGWPMEIHVVRVRDTSEGKSRD